MGIAKTINSIVVIFCLSIWTLSAQDPYHLIFNTNDGLPSDEVYDIHVDSTGLVWLTTDRGVCTYNGYEFEVFTTQNGLAFNTNFRIIPDAFGRLWFTGYDGSLSYFADGQFHVLALPDSLRQQNKGKWIADIIFSGTEQLTLFYSWNRHDDRNRTYFQYDLQTHQLFARQFSDLPTQRKTGVFEQYKVEGQLRYYFPAKAYLADIQTSLHPNHQLICLLPMFAKKKVDEVKPDTSLIYSIKAGEDDEIISIPEWGNALYRDHRGEIWMCTNDGLWLLDRNNLSRVKARFFSGTKISNVTQDREGNYWVATVNNGIKLVPDFLIRSPQAESGTITTKRLLSLAHLPNFLLFGGEKGYLGYADQNMQVTTLPASLTSTVTHINSNGERAFSSYCYRLEDQQDKVGINDTQLFDRTSFRVVKELEDGHLFIGRDSCKIIIPNAKGDFSSLNNAYTIDLIDQVYSVFEDRQGQLWLGMLSGLYLVRDYKNGRTEKIKHEALDTRINEIRRWQNEYMLIATMGNGLVIKNGDQYTAVTEADGLNSDLINTVYPQNDSVVWVGTNRGLNRLLFKNNTVPTVENIDNIQIADGLPSNFINAINYWSERVWLATNQGLFSFYPDDLTPCRVPPVVELQMARVSNTYAQLIGNQSLPYNQNDLLFRYLGIAFRKPTQVPFYRYSLVEEGQQDTLWEYTNNRSVQFTNLDAGRYTFIVTARNKNNDWAEAVTFPFSIELHFMKTLWFRSLALLTLLAAIYALFSIRSRNLLRREEQKMAIKEASLRTKNAELMALRKQMNPHFVFNALNSIQNYIFKKDVIQANHFLSKFSRLMRDSLQLSKLEYITLQQEMAFLTAYLELEQMRFPDKFNFSFDLEDSITPELICIPSLLLQPLLENAIKHGFKRVKAPGTLLVKIMTHGNECIRIKVIDNGAGIDLLTKPTENKSVEEYQSLGLKIIKDRIELLNDQSGDATRPFSFKIYNRQILSPPEQGTIAELILVKKSV